MNRLITYAFVAVVGCGVLNYYSFSSPLFAIFVLGIVALTFFAWLGRAAVKSDEPVGVKGFFSPLIVLWILFVGLPIMSMTASRAVLERGVWFNNFFNVLVFCLGIVIGLEKRVRGALVYAVLTVIAVSALTNLFEAGVHSYVWSIVPGRSAGFYKNPNTSAANLTAYSIIYFGLRPPSLKRFDFTVLTIACLGIFVTFSRTGYVLFALTVLMCLLSRNGFNLNAKSSLWLGMKLAIGAAFLWVVVVTVAPNMHLTDDAGRRLASFMEGNTGRDFYTERLSLGMDAWPLFMKSPLTGIGYPEMLRLKLGPHNIFVAVALAYGIGGLVAFVTLVIWTARAALHKAGTAGETWIVSMTCLWLAIFGFASHNILLDSTHLLALSISVALAASRSQWEHRSVKTVNLG